jgi:hypothetical protein
VLVEMLYFEGCPHYKGFAEHLARLIAQNNHDVTVQHTRVADSQEANRLRFLGSPSLRVNGKDVEPSALERTDFGMGCRLYHHNGETRGWPPDDLVVCALAEGERRLQ